MQTLLCFFLIFSAFFATGQSLRDSPQQALNRYVAFLNQSVNEVSDRFQTVQTYHEAIRSYKPHSFFGIRMTPSRNLEEYYYKKAINSDAFTEAEKERLKSSAQALWKLLNKIDSTVKALETYDRLKDYQRDDFKKATILIADFQALTTQFSRNKDAFYRQIQRVYRRYQPYLANDPYLYTEKEMEQVLVSQQQLLDTLSYYFNQKSPSNWPVELVQRSILADEKLLAGLGKAKDHIAHPASGMMASFKAGLLTIQSLKKRSVDDYNFAARQTSQHSNEFYKSFINYYNGDLQSWYEQFVNYSTSAKQLLNYPKYAPVFAIDVPQTQSQESGQMAAFKDVKAMPFMVKPAPSPVSPATFEALNAYIDFINESLRQIAQLQVLIRNYQSSADYFRDRPITSRRGNLTYTHDSYKVPVSEHQLLQINSPQIPQAYRASINGQADVLLSILKEMDALSIELINYTSSKQHEQDNLKRSDAILERYAYLFDAFDQKKEQLYRDVRRIYESFPLKKPSDSWNVAGKALLQMMDTNKEVLFGIQAYLKQETRQLPSTDSLENEARNLIINEFKNMKGLKRYGRNNGLCPYTPYENLAEQSLKLAEMPKHMSKKSSADAYEPFYYFYNQLVYNYNQFAELANVAVLKNINQPNVLILRRSTSTTLPPTVSESAPKSETKLQVAKTNTDSPTTPKSIPTSSATATTKETGIRHDTVYISQSKTDTVYIDRSVPPIVPTSLDGFAANNMILLLDVSGSMNSPYKLPLLKTSIKSLLKIVRSEDQLSIVIYSGKAKVALKPTSGSNANEITRVIDQLQSDGDTDGNGGLRLAYKVADKNYIRAGNNRIILATDGEFPVSEEVYQLVRESSNQDIYLTIFTFGKNEINSQNLKKLAQTGKGSYTHITQENANLQLILEAQAKKAR